MTTEEYFVLEEKENLKKREELEDLISICILKGKTTTEDQFVRLVNSLYEAIKYSGQKLMVPHFELFFMIDTKESMGVLRNFTEKVHKYPAFSVYCLNRVGDAGDLRNEFMGHLIHLNETHRNNKYGSNSFFGFMDGDDHVNKQFFEALSFVGLDKYTQLVIINPESVYSDDGMKDMYPSRWTFNSRNAIEEGKSIIDLALEDVIGGQSWGKYYSYQMLYSGAKFGKGLYEDVPFWYQICSCINGWDSIELVDGAIYYWRRDNTSSLTRVVPDWSSFCNAFDNLEKACEIAINKFKVKPSDLRVWKRYTTGILNLMRNAHKFDDEGVKKEYIAKIKARTNPEYFRPRELAFLEPKYVEAVKKDCPDYEEIINLDV